MKRYALLVIFLLGIGMLQAQMITGVWRGTITKGKGMFAKTMKVEVKLVKKGDSLVGTCYYYMNSKNYMRYSVRGNFDAQNNAVHWEEYAFIENKPDKIELSERALTPMKSTADFNCPNPNAVMKLDGFSEIGDGELFDTHLTKIPKSLFPDEWDNVIQGYTMGMADPDVIDSVWAITSVPKEPETIASVDPHSSATAATLEKAEQETIAKAKFEEEEKLKTETAAREKAAADEKAHQEVLARAKAIKEKSKQEAIAKATVAEKARQETAAKAKAAEEKTKHQTGTANVPKTDPPLASATKPTAVPAIAPLPEKQDPEAVQKFITRRKVQQGELPMQGDSIELHFYDNAEVDGDSISLFVNGKLLFNHVKLSTQPFVFKLGVKDLPDNSELAMLAENLGAIPPNTALMLAFINGERLSFRLESTEQSSGTIKMVRKE